MKQFYLNIHPDTFIWKKEGMVCTYSTDKGKLLKNELTEEMNGLIDDLLDINQLYTITISEEQLANPQIKAWTDAMLAVGCCSLVPCDDETPKPISLKPILKVTDDMTYYRHEHEKGTNALLMTNLHKLTFHLNGSGYGDDCCAVPCAYPFKNPTSVLDAGTFIRFIQSAGMFHSLSDVNLVGNVWAHPEANEIISFLKKDGFPMTLSCTENDFYQQVIVEKSELGGDCPCIVWKRDYPEEDPTFEAMVSSSRARFHFLVASEHDLEGVNRLMDQYNISDFKIKPYFNGHNTDFLEECVFLTEDELSEIQLSKREIFMHQTLNSNYFGNLTILPDGTVTNGLVPIGNTSDSLYDLVYKEMNSTSAWFHVRDEAPCKDCIYQWLCPSPSYLEFHVKRMNLCSIKK